MPSKDVMAQMKAAIAEITDAEISATRVDLHNCDREPIHRPAAIQPHGFLLVVNESDWVIVQASENVAEYLGQSVDALLGHPLSDLFEPEQIQRIEQCVSTDFEAANPLRFNLGTGQTAQAFSGVVHRSGHTLLLELEPFEPHHHTLEPINFFDFYDLVKRPINQIQNAPTVEALCQTAVTVIKDISGFDRVMVYRFDEDGSGSVIAEAKPDRLTPYLGLHYPATDIPKQAKYLYILNPLRLIPDATYTPVAIVPEQSPDATEPLDMSLASLRSVSPLHTEYLANMGVQASMSISIIQNQTLWGLIACHHTQPRQLSYELRSVCEFLGQVIGMELANRQQSEANDNRRAIQALQASFVDIFADNQTLQTSLLQNSDQLLGLVGAGGAVFVDKGEMTLLGNTPRQAELWPLVNWLGQHFQQEIIYQTACLSKHYSPAANFSDVGSGLLAISVSQAQQMYVLWFRPEVVQTVNWAGNPTKPINVDGEGEMRMSPRRSFEQWQQTVHQKALPWQEHDRETVLAFRRMIVGLVLQRADELAQLNAELERSNIELDSFAYVASHDLKEPLRGIYNYSSFLIEDYAEQLDQAGVDKLNTLMRLTQRMENLINSLLHYSQLGRTELSITSVDLKILVDGAIDVIKMSKAEDITFQVAQDLPIMECDRTRVTELFTNLMTNGIKYNSGEKVIDVGCQPAAILRSQGASVPPNIPADATVLYVRDNGIGIRPKHLDTVFRIFKRLHAQSRYGGGTGAGLTIVKKIVERHGGQIWIDSVYGEGSTFYFTLKGYEYD